MTEVTNQEPEKNKSNADGDVLADTAVANKNEVASSEAAKQETKALEIPSNTKRAKIPPWWRKAWVSLEDSGSSNRIIAVATVVIMAATCITCYEIISSSAQTDMLIEYASNQANSARRNALSATLFSKSADKISKSMNDAVANLGEQVDKLNLGVVQTSRLARDAETANANALESDRPWMGAYFSVDGFAVGKTPTITVTFVNTGKRPAKVTLLQVLATNQDYGKNPIYLPYDMSPSTVLVVPGQTDVAAWVDDDKLFDPISQELMTALDHGIIPFRVYAKAEYTDVGTNNQHWTHECWRYTPKQKAPPVGFSNCNEYNDAK